MSYRKERSPYHHRPEVFERLGPSGDDNRYYHQQPLPPPHPSYYYDTPRRDMGLRIASRHHYYDNRTSSSPSSRYYPEKQQLNFVKERTSKPTISFVPNRSSRSRSNGRSSSRKRDERVLDEPKEDRNREKTARSIQITVDRELPEKEVSKRPGDSVSRKITMQPQESSPTEPAAIRKKSLSDLKISTRKTAEESILKKTQDYSKKIKQLERTASEKTKTLQELQQLKETEIRAQFNKESDCVRSDILEIEAMTKEGKEKLDSLIEQLEKNPGKVRRDHLFREMEHSKKMASTLDEQLVDQRKVLEDLTKKFNDDLESNTIYYQQKIESSRKIFEKEKYNITTAYEKSVQEQEMPDTGLPTPSPSISDLQDTMSISFLNRKLEQPESTSNAQDVPLPPKKSPLKSQGTPDKRQPEKKPKHDTPKFDIPSLAQNERTLERQPKQNPKSHTGSKPVATISQHTPDCQSPNARIEPKHQPKVEFKLQQKQVSLPSTSISLTLVSKESNEPKPNSKAKMEELYNKDRDESASNQPVPSTTPKPMQALEKETESTKIPEIIMSEAPTIINSSLDPKEKGEARQKASKYFETKDVVGFPTLKKQSEELDKEKPTKRRRVFSSNSEDSFSAALNRSKKAKEGLQNPSNKQYKTQVLHASFPEAENAPGLLRIQTTSLQISNNLPKTSKDFTSSMDATANIQQKDDTHQLQQKEDSPCLRGQRTMQQEVDKIKLPPFSTCSPTTQTLTKDVIHAPLQSRFLPIDERDDVVMDVVVCKPWIQKATALEPGSLGLSSSPETTPFTSKSDVSTSHALSATQMDIKRTELSPSRHNVNVESTKTSEITSKILHKTSKASKPDDASSLTSQVVAKPVDTEDATTSEILRTELLKDWKITLLPSGEFIYKHKITNETRETL
ncbi:hypothetical protein BY458DRAFT_552391 [Sporodiniella umbellata]|nr:hypothetical protein BY458DRAFT_552391 [Sporodiniella umbellata]